LGESLPKLSLILREIIEQFSLILGENMSWSIAIFREYSPELSFILRENDPKTFSRLMKNINDSFWPLKKMYAVLFSL
jgi:hypothetical protein